MHVTPAMQSRMRVSLELVERGLVQCVHVHGPHMNGTASDKFHGTLMQLQQQACLRHLVTSAVWT